MREPGPSLQVPDCELDHGVAAVVGVEVDRTPDAIGKERVVAPGGKQLGLGGAEPGAADHQTVPVAIGALRDRRLASERAVDTRPGRLVGGLDDLDHALVLVDGDRIAHVVVPTGGDDVLEVEPRVGPGGHQRVLPEHLGVAVDLTVGGVDIGVVESHCKTLRTVRFCVHRSGAFLRLVDVCFSESHLPNSGPFSAWSRLS